MKRLMVMVTAALAAFVLFADPATTNAPPKVEKSKHEIAVERNRKMAKKLRKKHKRENRKLKREKRDALTPQYRPHPNR
jgi:hypothetical protein